MRRYAKPQGLAGRWLARSLDVDPHELPARFDLPLSGAPGRPTREADTITITEAAVAVERLGSGGSSRRETLPLDAFSGVAVRMDLLRDGGRGLVISVNLHHDSPDLCIPVHIAFDMEAAGTRWQSWGRALGLPLLLPAPGGGWRQTEHGVGTPGLHAPYRRNPRLALKRRRSLYSAVREVGHWGPCPVLAGTEIIART